MPETLEDLKRQLADARAARAALQPLLDETEGWDDVPESAIEEFVRGGAIAAADGASRFSSTQFNLADAGYTRTQGNPTRDVLDMAASIPDAELAADGREEQPHVTVKYGLHTDDASAVAAIVRGFGRVSLTLGKVSIFAANESQSQRGGDQFDVLKIDVEGDSLRELNRLLSRSLEVTDTHPVYRPHVTIAYLKPGEGAKYAGDDRFEGLSLLCRYLEFSNRSREATVIDLDPPIRMLPAI